MRKAQDKIREILAAAGGRYKDSAVFQDAVETLGGAAIAATGQAIFTDMTPEEIALSTLLGGAAAFGARPIAAQVGGLVGRTIDGRRPQALKGVPQDVAAVMPGSPAAVMNAERLRREATGDNERAALKILRDLQMAKYRQNFKGKGEVEGLLTAIGRYSGDNIAQGAVALGVPMLLAGRGEE